MTSRSKANRKKKARGRSKSTASDRTARATALAILARREKSRRQLEERLRSGGHAPSEVDEALDRLEAEGWLDDGRFADAFVRDSLRRGRGSRRIRWELERAGVAEAIAASAMRQIGNETETARQILERRWAGSEQESPQSRARAARFLARRGFPESVVRGLLEAP